MYKEKKKLLADLVFQLLLIDDFPPNDEDSNLSTGAAGILGPWSGGGTAF